MIKYASGQDPVTNDFNSFLLHYGIFLAIGVAVVVAIVVVILLLLSKKKNAPIEVKKEYSGSEVIDALGGKDNIVEHSKAGSRISIVLNNYDIVNESKLNELGVDSIIKMSNKITLVVKDDSDSFYKLFN